MGQKRRWLQKLLAWHEVDEMVAARSDFWAMRSLSINYISNPGHIDGRQLRPVYFQNQDVYEIFIEGNRLILSSMQLMTGSIL